MHELRIAEDLAGIVLGEAVKNKLSVVSGVNICLGELVQIVPSIFETAFREAVRDTIAADSLLDIEIVKLRLKCRECGQLINIAGNDFSCSGCGSSDVEIVNGKELFIKSIQGE